MKQEEWAERLNNQLKDYHQEPTRDLWEGIEASLDKQAKGPVRHVALRRWLIAAAIIGVLFGGVYLMWNNEPSQPRQAEAKTITNTEKHEDLELPETDVTPDIVTKAPEKLVAQIAETAMPTEIVAPEVSTPLPAEKTTQPDETAIKTKEDTPSPQVYHPLPAEPQAYPHVEHQQQKPLRLTMGLFAQGNTSNTNNTNAVMMNPQLLHRVSAARAFLVDYKEFESHNQPISFGITVGYPLHAGVSLSSGLVYTKLNSTFTTLMPNQQIQRHQKLHYIGVPLNLQTQLLQWHGISFYLTAGTQVDWNIKAESNTDGVNQVMDKDCMQWSVGGSLGLAYHIIPQLSLYVEPGVRHYIDNGSTINNYFKDKPTSFNLQLGLRFSLNSQK
jgi:hypothetical protein